MPSASRKVCRLVVVKAWASVALSSTIEVADTGELGRAMSRGLGEGAVFFLLAARVLISRVALRADEKRFLRLNLPFREMGGSVSSSDVSEAEK
jgi:hypothetical protein